MKLRTNVINAVFKRNFLSYFSGVLGYLFIVLFVALGSFFAFRPQFFANNLANLDQLNQFYPLLLIFFVPAITMSAWSEERKLGTDELLFTLPASDLEILLGKYAAVLAVYTVALLFSLSHVIVLSVLGSPDMGLVVTTYLGYWLSGAALLSAGMAASIVTSSATVAYVLGALVCAIPVFIDQIAPGSRLLQGLSVSEQFRDFGLGMIPLGGVLYFVSLTVVMLYLNLVLISRRHWAGGPHRAPMGLHFLVRTCALVAILIGANTIASAATWRIDLTSEKLYSLSPTTTKVLGSLKDDRPILVQAFISPEVPRELVAVRSSLIGLLRQYDQVGGNNLRVRIVNTEKFSDAADEAKRYGIEPQEMQSERAGRVVRDDVFLGVVVTGSVDDQVIIPFFDRGTPVEYELTRSIRTVSEANRKKIGILRTDAQVAGGFDMQSFRQLPEWRLVAELKKQYDVKQVGPDELATSDVDVLLAVMPSSLTDPEMQNLVDYIKKGRPALIIDDPFPIFLPGLAPRMPKPRPGGMMMGGPAQQKADNGEATKLSEALGITWDSGQTVWDPYDPHPEFREMLQANRLFDTVYISPGSGAKYAFNPDSPITQSLQEIMTFYPGRIRPREKSRMKFDPLLKAGLSSVTYEWDEYVRQGFMGGIELLEPPTRHRPDTEGSHVIAAHITGEIERANANEGEANAEPAGDDALLNVVFVADMDMISNTFFLVRDSQWQGLKLDNITFILNSVDALTGEDAFLALRSRRSEHRTLEEVEARTNQFKERQAQEAASADTEAERELQAARKKLDEEVEKIRSDKSLDSRTKDIMIKAALERQRRELEVRKANIDNGKNRKIRASRNETERDIRNLEDRIRLLAIVLPPVPALLLGIFVFAVRAKEERQGVVPDRLIGKQK